MTTRRHHLRQLALGLAACLGLFPPSPGLAQVVGASPSSAPVPPWPATDGLGRTLPMAGEVPGPRGDRFVGMFYFLWHDNRQGARPEKDGPYDIAKILQADPEAVRHPASKLWGPPGMFHYWAEPLYGYYLATDPWVIRRHARLLSDAGVDTLIFDATNALTYPEVYTRIGEVFREIRGRGGRTPQFAFMVNSQARATARQLYRDLYQPGRFRELWFQWQGKPLLLCDPAEAEPEWRSFFTLRKAHWPFTMVNTKDAWHWEATHPQPYGYTDDPGRAEQVNVSVAQNLRASDGQVTNMSRGDARGRSFHEGARDASPGALDRGGNFQEQWGRALELDPPFVLVTGWNEWVAGRFGDPNDPVVFVDQFDREFSRDIEPMKGGHGDAYYYQLVANVRRYKGVEALPKASPPRSIDLDAGPEAWEGVEPRYLDDPEDTAPRDFDGAGGTHYVDRSGRDDFVEFRVARADRDLVFLARTRQPLAPRAASGGVVLFVDADRNPRTGWEGFDFAVNRLEEADGSTWVEKNAGGWNWEKVAQVRSKTSGDRWQVAIPKPVLGLPAGKAPLAFDFKWADGLRRPGDVLDFYSGGDVAPEGRFKFRYVAD